MHFLRMRSLTDEVIGMYVVRTDTELPEDDSSKWPKDKLCFPWRTTCGHYQTPVNDVLFYIPRSAFNDLRVALDEAQFFSRSDLRDLHWLGSVPCLQNRIWLQYELKHPANTEWKNNPIYIIRGRP